MFPEMRSEMYLKTARSTSSGICNDDLYIKLLEDPQSKLMDSLDIKIEVFEKEYDENYTRKEDRIVLNVEDQPLKNLHLMLEETEEDETLQEVKSSENIKYEPIYNCNICKWTCKDIVKLQKHIKKVHHMFPCPYCSKMYKLKQTLYLHMRLNHEEDFPYGVTRHKRKQKSQLIKCSGLADLSKKSTSINRIAEILKSIKRTNGIGSRKKVQCKVCLKILRSKQSLVNHIDTIHTKIKPHKCKQCPSTFSNLSNLISHVNYNHSDKKSFKCSNCDKFFVHKAEVKKHYNAVHANLRPHKCMVCGRLFNHLSSLRRHNECVHENLRLFKCPKCSADYKDRNGLKKHLISFHIKGVSMRKRKDKSLPPQSLRSSITNFKYHIPQSLSDYILENIYP